MSKQHHSASVSPDGFIGFWQRKWETITLYFSRGLVLVIGIIVAIVGGWLISQYLDGRKERSTEKLAQAMKIAEANLISDQEKDVEQNEEVPRFKTSKERQDGVLKVLGELDKDFASTPAALRAVLQSLTIKNGIIFCNRKTDVDVVAKSLSRHGFDAAPQKPAEPVSYEPIGWVKLMPASWLKRFREPVAPLCV